jgi:hypothetical protein
MNDENRKEKFPIREESYFKNDDIENGKDDIENENDSQEEDDSDDLCLTSEQELMVRTDHFRFSLYFMFPDFFLSGNVADDFTYELPGNRKFRGKHLLDKKLYKEFMLMRSAYYYRYHCMLFLLCNYSVVPLHFLVYAKMKDHKGTKFIYKAVKLKFRMENSCFNGILKMKELPWSEAKVYNSMIQELMEPTNKSRDKWLAGACVFKEKPSAKSVRDTNNGFQESDSELLGHTDDFFTKFE